LEDGRTFIKGFLLELFSHEKLVLFADVTVDDDDDEGCDCVTIILEMTAFSIDVVGVGVLDVDVAWATPETSDAVAGVGDLERQFFNHNSGVIKFSTMIN
jgi:hypothetical protein